MTFAIVIAVIAILILLVLVKNICIVQQSRAYVIERLGAFSAGVGGRPPLQDAVH